MACRTRELGWGKEGGEGANDDEGTEGPEGPEGPKDVVGEVDALSLTSTVMRYKNGDGVKGELAELAISGAFALSHTSTQ